MASAKYGTPAGNQDDWYFIRGYARLFGLPDSKLDPAKGFPNKRLPPPPVGQRDYYSRGPGFIAGMAILIVLTATLGFTRLGLRYFRRDLRMGLDDLIILPAILLAIAWFTIILCTGIYGGAGKHLWDVTYSELDHYYNFNTWTTLIFWITVSFIKISITFFNRRLTGLTSKRWMLAHYAMLFILVSFLLSAVCVTVFNCDLQLHPLGAVSELGRIPSDKWHPLKCLDMKTVKIALAVPHIVTDFALLSVPLIILFRTKMQVGKKLRIGFLFSVGSISCIGAVMRMVHPHGKDSTFGFPRDIAWTAIDLFFGITAANLPVLNAALPKRWRSGPSSPRYFSFSISPFRSTAGQRSHRLGSKEDVDMIRSRPDGTVVDGDDPGFEAQEPGKHGVPESVDGEVLEKGSFAQKTEKRWEDAYEDGQQKEKVQSKRGTRTERAHWEDYDSTTEGSGSERA